MDSLIEFIFQYAHVAHWFIFGALLLAGMSIPISIDLIMLFTALLAATVIPEHTLLLFFTLFLGCCLSAWIAYGIGRTFGNSLFRFRWFSKLLPSERLQKMRAFYEKHGLLTLVIGRFIPFGVRNGIFMTTGLSKMPFAVFALRDALACFLWCTVCFPLFYTLSQHHDLLITSLKTFNLLIFLAFSVTVIGVVWYKVYKKKNQKNC